MTAAGRVFARRGYETASIADIAEEAGYSHGAVYSNFASKQDLFLALYERWVAERVAEIDATSAPGLDLREHVRANVVGWLEYLTASPAAFLLRLEFTLRAVHDESLQRELGIRVGAVPLALRRGLERIADDHELKLSLSPGKLAALLQALSLGFALEAVASPQAMSPQLAGDLAASFADLLTDRRQTESP